MLLEGRNVLVTGGAGFVGNCLVSEILQTEPGANVVVLDSLFNGHREFLPVSDRVVLEEVDVRDAAGVLDVIERSRPEVVINLAALHYIPYCNQHPAETMEVNVVGLENVLAACRKHAPSRIVIASSAAVYPICDGPNREDDEVAPTDIYGLTKWVNERQLRLHASQTDTRCAAARIANVVGPRETNPHVVPEIVQQLIEGTDEIALGNLKPKRDYIYVRDVARGLLAIARGNRESFRVFNLCTGREYSIEEILEVLSTLAGRGIRVRSDPERRAPRRPHALAL